jgi:HlyD family secretion protein
VQQGQVLAELECAEQRAALDQADAALEGARIGLLAAKGTELLAKEGIRGAASQLAVARAAAEAAKAQKQATEVQRGAAERASKRVQEVHTAGAVSDQALDQSETQLQGLEHQLAALGANLESAYARTVSATSARQAAVIQSDLASAEIRGAEQKLKAAQALHDQAATAVSECSLPAPRDGIVQERNFEPGEVVLPGSRVLTLVDIREVKDTF